MNRFILPAEKGQDFFSVKKNASILKTKTLLLCFLK